MSDMWRRISDQARIWEETKARNRTQGAWHVWPFPTMEKKSFWQRLRELFRRKK